MLRFLDNAKFSLAPRQILECDVDPRAIVEDEDDLEGTAHLVRELRADDFDAIVRIDKQITGQDRAEYLRRKFDEVLHESAIAVSLVVEDDKMPVGFVMARVDFGDFGHVEPAAALDTIGVHPGFAGKGLAKALLAQLMRNLSGLRVERIETELARETFTLLGFLYGLGFRPSQRLAFAKRLR
jgi:ribosomal protein S18 acetylase RimI-like enzyme